MILGFAPLVGYEAIDDSTLEFEFIVSNCAKKAVG